MHVVYISLQSHLKTICIPSALFQIPFHLQYHHHLSPHHIYFILLSLRYYILIHLYQNHYRWVSFCDWQTAIYNTAYRSVCSVFVHESEYEWALPSRKKRNERSSSLERKRLVGMMLSGANTPGSGISPLASI